MNLPPHLQAHLAKKRSLYEALVARANERNNDMDGSTAMRAIPAKRDKTWLEVQGLTNEDTSDLFLACMQAWLDGTYTGDGAYSKYQNDLQTLRLDSMEGAVVRKRIRASMGNLQSHIL